MSLEDEGETWHWRVSRDAQDCIPTSLLKLSADNSTRAVKMFAGVQKYMAESGDAPTGAAKAELVQKLLHQVGAPAFSSPAHMIPEHCRDTSVPPNVRSGMLPRMYFACLLDLYGQRER